MAFLRSSALFTLLVLGFATFTRRKTIRSISGRYHPHPRLRPRIHSRLHPSFVGPFSLPRFRPPTEGRGASPQDLLRYQGNAGDLELAVKMTKSLRGRQDSFRIPRQGRGREFQDRQVGNDLEETKDELIEKLGQPKN